MRSAASRTLSASGRKGRCRAGSRPRARSCRPDPRRAAGEAAAAEGGHQACLHQRGLARAAVARDHDQRLGAQQLDQLFGLLVAAEEQMRLAAVVGLEADERIGLGGDAGARLEPQYRPKQLRKLFGALRIADALILRQEARQVGGRGPGSQDRHQRIGGFSVGAVECHADLVPDPVHHAAAADIDGKRGRIGQARLQRVLPPAAGTEVDLVDPDFQAALPSLWAVLDALGEAERCLAVDTGMREEQEMLLALKRARDWPRHPRLVLVVAHWHPDRGHYRRGCARVN